MDRLIDFDLLPASPSGDFDNKHFLDKKPMHSGVDTIRFLRRGRHAEDSQLSAAEGRRIKDTQSQPFEHRHRFACWTCDQRFSYKKSLTRHRKSVHQQRYFPCSACTLGFNRKDIRDRHYEEQHGGRTGTVECMRCGEHIRERAFKHHFKSRKCQKNGTRNSDFHDVPAAMRIIQGYASLFFSLDVASTCSPLLVYTHLAIKILSLYDSLDTVNRLMELVGRDVDYWKLRSLAVRTLSKAIGSADTLDDVVDAILVFIWADVSVHFMENISVHRRAIKWIESRHPGCSRGRVNVGLDQATFPPTEESVCWLYFDLAGKHQWIFFSPTEKDMWVSPPLSAELLASSLSSQLEKRANPSEHISTRIMGSVVLRGVFP